MIKPPKIVIAGAAVAGLLAGSMAVRTYAASTPKAGTALQTVADDEKGKHSCKGQNECTGQGGCKSGDNSSKGKNSCKGKDAYSTDAKKPPQKKRINSTGERSARTFVNSPPDSRSK